jgi:DNA-binding NarL/FixJ family response regulator
VAKKVRVLLADDHQVLREGLAAILAAQKDIELVGQAADGQEAVERARTLRPDVVVMDITMPKLSGIEATRRISAELPAVQVIGFSVQQQEHWARALRQAGAVACLCKGAPMDELVGAIRACRARGRARKGS